MHRPETPHRKTDAKGGTRPVKHALPPFRFRDFASI